MPDPGMAARGQNNSARFGQSDYYDAGPTDVMTYDSKANLLALQSEAPELDPGTQWRLASAGMPQAEMLNAARSAVGIGSIKQTAAALAAQPDAVQRAQWALTSPERQKLLLEQGGYTPVDVKAQRSEKWWQTGALAPVRGATWLWDKSGADSLSSHIGLTQAGTWTLDKLTNLGDDVAGRPIRYMHDQSGQEQAARMDLTLAQARQDLEGQGFSLNDAQWENLKWRYLQQNPLTVNYLGAKDHDPGRAIALKQAASVIPGGGMFAALGDIASNIPGVKELPGIKQIGEQIGTKNERYNPYEATAQAAPDSVYQAFEDKVNLLKSRPDYSMTPWASWNRVDNGTTYVSPLAHRRAMEALGGRDSEGLDLAVWRSQGRSTAEFVTDAYNIDPTDPRFDATIADLTTKYEGNADWQRTLAELSRDQSKISFGRDYARTMGIPDDTALFTIASGAADAGHVVAMDPTLVLGKATKIGRVARMGVALEELDNVVKVGNAMRLADEGVLKVAHSAEELAQLSEAQRALTKSGWLSEHLADSKLGKLDDLIDESGNATPFLADNYYDVRSAIDKAVAKMPASARAEIGDHLDVVQHALNSAPVEAILDTKLTSIRSRVLRMQTNRTMEWADRVVALGQGLDQNAPEAIAQAVQDIPHILPGLPALEDWHVMQRAAGGPGLTTREGVFQALTELKTEVGLGGGVFNGSAVRGFGNGVHVPDRWRLFADATEDVPRFGRAREELLQLPEISKTTDVWLRTKNRAEAALWDWKNSGGESLASKGVNKPKTMAGALVSSLTHQMPRMAAVPLTGAEFGTELRKVRDMGMMLGLSRERGDRFFGEMLAGLDFDQNLRFLGDDATREASQLAIHDFTRTVAARDEELVKLNGLVDEGVLKASDVPDALDSAFADPVLRSFSKTFSEGPIVPRLTDADGMATDWFKSNYEDVMEWRNNLLRAHPELADHQVLASLNTVGRNGTFNTVGTRMALLKGYLDEAMEAAGVKATPQGKEWADNFLGRLRTSRYSGNDLDLFKAGSETYRQGLLPVGHHSDWMAIPDFNELQRAATEVSVLQRSFNKLNNPWVDALMAKGWKPITLMRLGFIPRAVGEEALAFFSQRGVYTLGAYAGSWATHDRTFWPAEIVRKVLRQPAYKWGELYGIENADELWNMVNVLPYHSVSQYMADMARTHLGDAARINTFDRLALAADYAAAKVSAQFKRMEFALVPEQMKRAVLAEMGLSGAEDRAIALRFPEIFERYTKGVAEDALALMRHDELTKRAHAEALSGLGKRQVYTAEEGWGAHEKVAIKNNAYSDHDVAFLDVRTDHQWRPLEKKPGVDDVTAIDYAYSLNKQITDPVMMAGVRELGGSLREEDLLGPLASALREPVFRPTVAETAARAPEMDAAKAVADDLAADPARLANDLADLDPTVAPFDPLEAQWESLVAQRKGPDLLPEGSEIPLSEIDPSIDWTDPAEQSLANRTLMERVFGPAAEDEAEVATAVTDAARRELEARVQDGRLLREELDTFRDEYRTRPEGDQGFGPADHSWDDLANPGAKQAALDESARTEMADELARIEAGELRPQDSTYWRTQSDRRVQAYLRQVQGGAIAPDEIIQGQTYGWRGTATTEDAQRVLDKAEQLRQRVNAWPEPVRDAWHRWLQVEINDGPAFVGQLSPKLRKQAHLLETLSPGLRQTIEHTPADSPLHDVVAAALRNAAKGDTQMLDDLTVLSSFHGTRIPQALSGEVPLFIGDAASNAERVRTSILAALQDSRYSKYVNDNPRSFMVDGAPVAMPPTGKQRVYSVMGDADTVSAITRLHLAGQDNEILTALRAVGMTDDQERMVRTMLNEWDSKAIDAQLGAAAIAKQGTVVPMGRVQYESFDQAEELAKLFDAAAFDTGGSKVIATGYADVAPGRHGAEFGGGELWRQTNPGQLQLDDVTLYRTTPYRDMRRVRYDRYGIPDPKGEFVSEGVDRSQALHDFADVLTREGTQSFTTADGQVLHELVHPGIRGRFDVSAVKRVAPADLPSNLYAPTRYVVPTNWWSQIVNKGFDQVINPAIFAGVRHPRYMMEFSDALAGTRSILKAMRDPELDSRLAEIITAVGGNVGDVRTAWHAIPEAARFEVRNGMSFLDAAREAARLDLLDNTNPIFKLSHEELDEVARWARRDAHVEGQAVRTAIQRAMDSMVPYIDDHEVRSFFQGTVRNVMPFQFATEQFLKRWVNTFRYSPEAVRRAQLLIHGFNSSGFVHQDEYGNRVFVIPGSEALGQLMGRNRIVSSVFGKAAAVPISVPLTADVRSILPGVPGDVENLPSVSPIAMVPARMVVGIFPEARHAIAPFTGGRPIEPLSFNSQGLTEAVIGQFIPANIQRAYTSLFGAPTAQMESELNKATIGAMQMMEAEAIRLRAEGDALSKQGDELEAKKLYDRAEDLSPGDTATEVQMEAYLDKVRDWARSNMMTRAVTGFVSPAAGRNEFEGMGLRKEFTDMLSHMDFDEALAVFLAEHPDGRPWTVFDTTKSTKAPIAPTEAALNWLDENGSYLDAYPKAGPWLMPQSDGSDEFSQQAYLNEVAIGMRSRMKPEEWYRAYKWAGAANVYFPAKTRVDAALLNADSETRKQINASWQAWSTAFKNQHPVFAAQLNGGKQDDTDATLEELRVALADPAGPKVEHKAEMAVLVNSYFSYNRERQLLAGDNSTPGRERKKQIDAAFLDWGWQFVSKYPTVRSLWTSLIVPAADLRALDQALALNAGGR